MSGREFKLDINIHISMHAVQVTELPIMTIATPKEVIAKLSLCLVPSEQLVIPSLPEHLNAGPLPRSQHEVRSGY